MDGDTPNSGPKVLPAILDALNGEVLSELKLAGSIDHPGESGRAREQIITRFLQRLLPSGYEIGTGFVIDAVGGISRQVDLVVHRVGYHPVLEIGGIRHFLVESVAAVVENKAAVDSVSDLRSALENVASVKRLDRSNRARNTAFGLSSRGPVDRDSFQHQIFGAIVTEASLAKEAFAREYLRLLLDRPRIEWPNHYVDVHRFAAGYWMPDHRDTPTDSPHPSFGAIPWDHMATVDAARGWYPLVSLAYELCNYLRVAPLIDYSAADYLAPPEEGSVRWYRISPTTLGQLGASEG
jgi:hypothetical protein